ncbi:MAG: hypothetical protein JWR69_2827 [Pedosphaera sp.]|nr:hypothetical protein [Pedosphaera sp.]
MSDPKNNGKTLWEMLTHRGQEAMVAVAFRNPLDLRIGSSVLVSHVNGPEFEGYDFSVKEAREYVRRIGTQEFGFTDYVLKGTNTKTFDAADEVITRLRLVPNAQGTNDSAFLRLYDEFAFSEDFLAVVKDTTGVFEISDDKTDEKEIYNRINDVRDAYEANVLIITATTEEGKAPAGTTKAAKLEYWDYWRDREIGGGKTAKQFIFVEMDSDTGWFQIWRGSEFFL